MNKAIFFDRDGVITKLVINPSTGEVESANNADELEVMPGAIEALLKAQNAGFKLFIVSNQPSYAKGKTTLENLKAAHEKLHKIHTDNKIRFTDYYYCYHHPEGVVPGYSGPCGCRKPSTDSLKKARDSHGVDLKSSWFVGDQDMDIECGQGEGLRTILIENDISKAKRGKSKPDYFASNIQGAVDIIVTKEKGGKND